MTDGPDAYVSPTTPPGLAGSGYSMITPYENVA